MNKLERLKAIRANVRDLRHAAMVQHTQGAFNHFASMLFLRRLREAERVEKVATRMVIGVNENGE